MKDTGTQMHRRWKGLSRWVRILLLSLGVLLIAARLAMPYAVQRFVNWKLDKLPEYDGRIGEVDIHLIRGAYTIHGVKIVRTGGEVPIPFVDIRQVDFSVEWRELLHGSIVSEIVVDHGQVNFVKGKTKEDSQTAADKSWIGLVDDLFPFQINRVELRDSAVWFRDATSDPKVDIYMTNLNLVATNLTNSRDLTNRLPAGISLSAVTLGEGLFNAQMLLNPMAAQAAFDLDASITNLNLVALNPFLLKYAKVDVTRGKLNVFTELAAEEGKFAGYVTPLIEDLDVVDLQREKNPIKAAWEIIVGTITKIFKNHSKDRLGTKIPLKGEFSNPRPAILEAIVNTLHNAFVQAFPKAVEGSISGETVEGRK